MRKFFTVALALTILVALSARAQNEKPAEDEYATDDVLAEEPFEDPIPAPPPLPGEEGAVPKPPLGEEGEGPPAEDRYGIDITGAVQMNYVFSDSPDNFTVKYVFELKAQANAAVAVLKGDAKVTPTVSGALSKWPSGECKLEVSVSTIPYELTFKKTDDNRANIKIVLKKSASEDWESKCSFQDAPEKKFNTRGTPELWFMKAIEKAKPSLKDMSVEIDKDEEASTSFTIAKEIINDAPVGSGEIEGRGAVTIKPGF